MTRKSKKTKKTDERALAPASVSPNAFPNGIGRTVSGELNYLMRRMMQQGADGVAASSDEKWPVVRLEGDHVSAEVVFSPQAQSPQGILPEDQVEQYRKRMWYLVQSMDDLTADCWDALVSQWVAEARSPDGKVWISVDQILRYRGLASHQTGRTRGGYTAEQRAAVTEALLRIISMRLQGFTIDVLEEQDDGQGRRLVPVRRQIGGPALEVGLDLTQTDFLGHTEIKALLVRPGEMFARYYMGAGRSVALLSQKALTYQPYREVWEKRLTRYFAYSWDRRHDGVARQQHTIAELLEATQQTVNPTRPDATKDRLEKALHRLVADGVIAGWDYVQESWDEANRPRRHWAPVWLEARVDVMAPDEVQQFYQLALPEESVGLALAPALPPGITEGHLTGEAVAALRSHYGLSQDAFARELGVSRTLINLIENGKRSVSSKVRKDIADWLAKGRSHS
jgi:DNA-binding XRE family transcriptional regulator